MNVALGGTSTPLGRTLAAALSADHRVVALPDDPREPEQVRRALTGIDAVILLPPAVATAAPAPDSAAEALQTDWRRARELLDRATRGTYTVCTAALEAGVRRVVLGSALSLFERYPPAWAVTESWRPLPDVRDPVQLATYLAEASAKQLAHSEPLQVVCLRFGTLVDDATISGRPYDPRWVHVADVVQAYRLAVDRPPRHRAGDDERQPVHGWWVYHIPGGGADTRWPLAAAQGERGLGYQPTYDFAAVPGAGARPAVGRLDPAALAGERATLEPSDPIPTRPIRRVVLLGAGGPLAAVTARELAASYRLRLTDRRPLAEIVAAATPQSPGAPTSAAPGRRRRWLRS